MCHDRTIPLLVAALSIVTIAGCGAVSAARNAARQNQSASQMKQLSLAILTYRDMKGEWPERFDDVSEFTEGADGLASLLINPATGDNPGYEYVKPTHDEVNMAETIIIYQLTGGERDLTLPVAYADSSVRPPDA